MSSISFETTQAMTAWEEDVNWDGNWDGNMTMTEDSAPAPSSIIATLFPAILVCLIILANITSLTAFCVERRLRTYNNYFIINLSILDLLVGLRLVVSVTHTHFGYFPFSQNACKLISGFANAMASASNLTVVVICVDRHRATYDPINHFMTRSKQKALLKNALPWLFGLAFWIPYIIVWEFVDDFDNGLHCIRRYQRGALTQIIQLMVLFFVPFVIIAILYFRIFIKIKSIGKGSVEKQFAMKDPSAGANRSNVSKDSSAEDIAVVSNPKTDVELKSPCNNNDTIALPTTAKNAQSKIPNPAKRESTIEMRKATRTLLLIVIAFVIAWLPSSIIQLTYAINPVLVREGLPTPAYIFFSYLVYSNNLLNPISYAVSQPLFRSTVINMFLCRRR